MNIEDLKNHTAADQVAMLCGCADEELDRLAAEVQGWKSKQWSFGPIWFLPSGELYEHPCLRPEYMRPGASGYYYPSRDLNQAYELTKLPIWVVRDYDDDQRQFYLNGFSQDDGMSFAEVWQDQAGSHARAVTILAIVGLLATQD